MSSDRFPGSVFIVVAPSGAGKSSLVNALLAKDNNISLSISCTTRAPRPGEQDKEHYYFVSNNQFDTLKTQNALLEWAHVHGNYYGTPKEPVEQALLSGQDVLLEIDWQGARQVRENFPQAVGIFILPPSLAILEERLRKRGQDSEEVIQRRIQAAAGEISHAHECQYAIINQDFDTAVKALSEVVAASRLRVANQAARHATVFQQLGL